MPRSSSRSRSVPGCRRITDDSAFGVLFIIRKSAVVEEPQTGRDGSSVRRTFLVFLVRGGRRFYKIFTIEIGICASLSLDSVVHDFYKFYPPVGPWLR